MIMITRKKKILLIFTLLIMLFTVISVYATDVPLTIAHQGKIADTRGIPLTGEEDLVFKIYGVLSGGTPIFTRTKYNVEIIDGYYQVNIDIPLDSIGENLFQENSGLYLETTVGTGVGAEILAPRIKLLSVPYAYSSQTAEFADYATSVGEIIGNPSGSNNDIDTETIHIGATGVLVEDKELYYFVNCYSQSYAQDTVRADGSTTGTDTNTPAGTHETTAVKWDGLDTGKSISCTSISGRNRKVIGYVGNTAGRILCCEVYTKSGNAIQPD
jgi:hypothetical protein